jgi:hypothetical protein
MHHCSSNPTPTRCTTAGAIPSIIPTIRCQSPCKIQYSAFNSTPHQQPASGCLFRHSFLAYLKSLIFFFLCIQRKPGKRLTSHMHTRQFTSHTPSPLSRPARRRVPSVPLPEPVHVYPLDRARRRQQHTSCTTHTTRYSSRHTRHT